VKAVGVQVLTLPPFGETYEEDISRTLG